MGLSGQKSRCQQVRVPSLSLGESLFPRLFQLLEAAAFRG